MGTFNNTFNRSLIRLVSKLNLTDEYKAILSSLTGAKPIKSIMVAQDKFIRYLKGNNTENINVWDKFVCLIVPMAKMPEDNDALLWWTNPTKRGTLSATPPTYENGGGFKGNGINAYFGTGFNPSIDGEAKYTQNDCSMIVLFTNHRTTVDYSGAGIVENTSEQGISVQPMTSSERSLIRTQALTYQVVLKSYHSTKGLFSVSRVSSNLALVYFGFNKLYEDATDSYQLQNKEATGLKINGRSVYSQDTIGIIGFGSSLSAADIEVLNSALADFDFNLNSGNNGIFISDYSKRIIPISTYDGSGVTVHPAVLNLGNVWNGYQYWLAITPYPKGNDDYENPSIYASNDGISWVVPAGLTNPIEPFPGGINNYNADPFFIFRK